MLANLPAYTGTKDTLSDYDQQAETLEMTEQHASL